jgi:phage terminase large subunit GpA-like protein
MKSTTTTTLSWSSTTGKSEINNNWVCRTSDCDPIPILLVQPTVKTAEDYSRLRIELMFKESTAADTIGKK